MLLHFSKFRFPAPLKMLTPRNARRLTALAVILFIGAGLVIASQRPQNSLENLHFMPSLHDLVSGPAHFVLNKPEQNNANLNVANSNPHENPNHKTSESSDIKLLMDKLDPCTVISPVKGYIDMSGLSAAGNSGKLISWTAKDYSSGHNYTVGICLTPIKKSHLPQVEIVDGLNASNVGAYYTDAESGHLVSMGDFSTSPRFNGRKLTLTYSNGSYCDGMTYKNGEKMRKRTVLTFTCDRDILTKAHVSYVASVDDCTYIFEVRSHLACPTAAKADNLAAIWIFLLIILAALFVYLSGGLLYKTLKLR